MNDQKFEELARRYPALLQKAKVDSFYIDDGWYHIIDTLCGLICSKLEQAQTRLRYAIENGQPTDAWEFAIEEETKALPTIMQAKEKFGNLRFHVAPGVTDEIRHYITFAQHMSRHVCEKCGSPGEIRNDGWSKVLCGQHHKERQGEPSIWDDMAGGV